MNSVLVNQSHLHTCSNSICEQQTSLLRDEYLRTQRHLDEVNNKYAVLLAQSRSSCVLDERTPDSSHINNVLSLFTQLCLSPKYSDLQIYSNTEVFYAHKIVMSTRKLKWGLTQLDDTSQLDWTHLSRDVVSCVLRWIYTNQVNIPQFTHISQTSKTLDNEIAQSDFSMNAANARDCTLDSIINEKDRFLLSLLRAANEFMLDHLKLYCENALIVSVNSKTCLQFYIISHSLDAKTLKDYCYRVISINWNEFSENDFVDMNSQLLYDLIKKRTSYPLHSAIRLRREDVVHLILADYSSELHARVNELDDRQDVALDLALQLHHMSVCDTLLKYRANVDMCDSHGNSLLLRAIFRNDEQSCIFLLDNGAQTNCVSDDLQNARTPLHILALDCSDIVEEDTWKARIARKLILCGANINSQDSEHRTPLHLAVISSSIHICDVLLASMTQSRTLQMDLLDIYGYTPLWYALEAESFKLARRLVQMGVDVNVKVVPSPSSKNSGRGNTILHETACEKMEQAGEFLIESGANVNACNDMGQSVMHLAAANGLVRLVTCLLEHGVFADRRTPSDITDNITHTDPSNGIVSNVAKITSGSTSLHLAVLNCHICVVEAILKFQSLNENMKAKEDVFGVDIRPDVIGINARDSSHDLTALGLALYYNQFDIAQKLVEFGANLNTKNCQGNTLLVQSLQQKNLQVANFLLHHHADMSIKSCSGNSCLHLAIVSNLFSCVEYMCLHGVSLQHSTDEDSYLWTALSLNHISIADILIKYKIDTNCWFSDSDKCYQTLLHRAIDESNSEIAKYLIKSGCDYTSPRRSYHLALSSTQVPSAILADDCSQWQEDGMTPLHLCCEWGLTDTLSCLLEHGASVLSRDSHGRTPLHVAVSNGYDEIVRILLSCPEQDLFARDNCSRTPLHLAVSLRNNHAAQAILDSDPTAAEQYDTRGHNFLHCAVEKCSVEAVMFLLSIHVNVNTRTRDSNQYTPLHLACQTSHSDTDIIIRNLILAGADVNELTHLRQSCLHLAVTYNCHLNIAPLVQNDINVNAQDANLDNALHIACIEGDLTCVRELLTVSNIDAAAINLRGRTPLHCIVYNHNNASSAICQLFYELMPDYPVNIQDVNGDTALYLSYTKANVSLCMSLMKFRPILCTINNERKSIFNHETPTKQLLYRMLENLVQEPTWSDGEFCMECEIKFSIATRKHHCRHCGRVLCNKCSRNMLVIAKYALNKPVRVCEVCYDVLTLDTTAIL